ncbi:MAG: hypothetical protein WC307_03615 [Candidatus Nanoarchaeia archaeon]|jgi:Ca2+/Na+ antiporter
MNFKTLPIIIFVSLIGITIISFFLKDYLITDILVITFLVLFYYYVIRYEIKHELNKISNDFKSIEQKFEQIETILLKEEKRLEVDINKLRKLRKV